MKTKKGHNSAKLDFRVTCFFFNWLEVNIYDSFQEMLKINDANERVMTTASCFFLAKVGLKMAEQ